VNSDATNLVEQYNAARRELRLARAKARHPGPRDAYRTATQALSALNHLTSLKIDAEQGAVNLAGEEMIRDINSLLDRIDEVIEFLLSPDHRS